MSRNFSSMPWNSKSTAQAKKVAPPAIPLDHQQHQRQSSISSTTDHNTIPDDGISLQLLENSVAYKMKENSDYGFTKNNSAQQSSTSANTSFGTLVGGHPLTHKAAVYYHQQLALQEDQGIDLAQSPGRDSPGSSSGSAGSGSGSRHSTASLDSGRASSYITTGGSSGGPPSIRGGHFSSPRCSSVSSCSIGSVDRISQRSENDILDWLIDVKFEEYSQLFMSAGYDIPTISRMTPEDLTAIGITNPQHRERIKKQIDKLQVVDNLPDFVPGSIEEWLRLLRLEDYIQPLLDQNYKTVRDVTQVTWEDLEDIGIVKLGHQKKILLAIKRVKDILSGKRHHQNYLGIAGSGQCGLLPTIQQYNPSQYYQQQLEQLQLPPPPQLTQTPTRISWDDSRMAINKFLTSPTNTTNGTNEVDSENNIVLIKVRQPRGKSLESLEDISDRNNTRSSHLTFSHYSTGLDYHYIPQQNPIQHQQKGVCLNPGYAYPPGTVTWRRSYDDGDITPTNESALYGQQGQEGGGTLPRQQRAGSSGRNLMSERALSHEPSSSNADVVDYSSLQYNPQADMAGTYISNSRRFVGMTNQSPLSKKIAPDPPRRNCSMRNSRGIGYTSQDMIGADPSIAQTNYLQMPVGALSAVSAGHHIPSNIVGAGSYGHQQQQPIYMNYSQIHQTTTQAEVHCENPYENKRDSSIDSIDTIPFANENTGTIKQKLYKQDIVSSLSLSSSTSSSSSSTNTVANVAQSMNSLKLSSPSSLHGLMISGCGSSGSGGDLVNCVDILDTNNQIIPTTTEDICGVEGINNGASGGNGSSNNSSGGGSDKTTDSLNVLNDIGNMLANLTDELDAMLEEEKRVGINDSE